MPPRLLRARVRDSLHGTEFLTSVFLITNQAAKARPSHPAFWCTGSGVLSPGPCPGHNRACLPSPLLNSKKLADHCEFCYWFHPELEKRCLILFSAVSLALEQKMFVALVWEILPLGARERGPKPQHKIQWTKPQNSRSQTQFQVNLAPWYPLSHI